MTQENSVTLREAYEDFIDEVLDTEIIWGLANEEGWAMSDSNDFEDKEVIPFWSNEKLANALCNDEWQGYRPSPIRFDEFIDAWLHGMHEDDVLAGINWNTDLVGSEVEPIMLIEDLIGEE